MIKHVKQTTDANLRSRLTTTILFAAFMALTLGVGQISQAASRFTKVPGAQVITLADVGHNLSGITFNADTNTYFLIQNNTGFIYEYDRTFSAPLRRIQMLNLEDDDTEDIVYLGQGLFALVNERNQVVVFPLRDRETTVDLRADRPGVQVYQLPYPQKKNKGLEGICFVPPTKTSYGIFYVAQEADPIRVYSFQWATNPKISQPLPTDRIMKRQLKDVSGCLYHPTTGRLLFLSHESSRIMDVGRDGSVHGILDLPAHGPQYEGLTFGARGELVLVSEPNIVVILNSEGRGERRR